MRHRTGTRDARLSLWLRVREFAVPPSMIRTATVRRAAGDWAGACAAARVDVDLDLRAVARTHGRQLAARVRADLRHLAPDLLRWHLPRIAPDGLLRPGLTIPLARYGTDGQQTGATVHLVARTPPAWADAGQRISLAVRDGSGATTACSHPHPRPHRRFRLDLHRHLWDARRAGELWTRSGADLPASVADAVTVPVDEDRTTCPDDRSWLDPAMLRRWHCAVDRWADEARLLLQSQGRADGAVAVRLGGRRRLVLDPAAHPDRPPRMTTASAGDRTTLPVLPDAATWVPPDLTLLRAGLIDVDRLHPLVAAALTPGRPAADPPTPDERLGPRLVACRGEQHRIGLVDGVLVALDHDPAQIRREELLAALTGTPLPCLQVIDEAHRHPECLVDVRARLDHGDTAGALAAVEELLGPGALLRAGALREVLEAAARRRVTHGLFRAGLAGLAPPRTERDRRPRGHRPHPRHATRP
ncbi:hypothetical protein ACPFP2_21760 [Micromonospora citrea]|uniref:hypothetical protein n=1 Tax=Micromonospora citrea TaxID=47855 RepID=UPI003C33C5AF